MDFLFTWVQWIFLIPAAGGALFGVLCLLAVWRFRPPVALPLPSSSFRWPPVTVLKPVCGLEKNLKMNLTSACRQDYPEFQVIFSVQDSRDPAIPLLLEIQREYPGRATVVVEDRRAGPNGKVNNLLGALSQARHDILVISDSDVRLAPDYLKNIVAPLADARVGFVCTLYRATQADRWFEKMELLTLNADFVPSVVFAYVSGAAKFCLGSSVAFRRAALQEVGGLESLADYLAEDYELGRRLWRSGKKMVLVPYWVDTVVDLKTPAQWWNHQVCWDQKTRAARPAGFFATIATRSVPFALFWVVSRSADPLALAVLGAVLALRLGTAALIMGWGLGHRESLWSLALLPLRDMAALASWAVALTKRKVSWRGLDLTLLRNGRLAPSGFHRD